MRVFIKIHDLAPRLVEILDAPLMIGRHPDASIYLAHPTISKRHALITRQGEAIYLQDLGSTCGIYVNGHKARGRHPLTLGDAIRLGQITLELIALEVLPPP
ncbi:FHA domain-containing protein [Myxococcota bacterium]|nr:FHA domain-containing protein [Myxococcota bacterium]MBU1433041.1 FHA domain-containing protein [Myxococcota bacterium]MBU1899924.1 FHA domain-containing protein [Myxococcota bacterium]